MVFIIKIAYLVLAHTDPKHIARLANKVSESDNIDVYIHIDKKIDITPFIELIPENNSVFFIKERYSVSWAAYSSIKATLALIKKASENNQYDRFILLQGLDYPLVSNSQMISFFEENAGVEYIRACKITGSNDIYHSKKCECYWFYEQPNFIKKAINKITNTIPIRLRRGYIKDNGRYDIYWGSAQWALTGDCIKYIMDFVKTHPKFNDYFKYVFAPDETYFQTIVFNSIISENTFSSGAEPEKRGLTNWRNLHYFEYGNSIKIFDENDYETLVNSGCLFFRKATTEKSTSLLDKIDKLHMQNV